MAVQIVPATFNAPADLYFFGGANIYVQSYQEPPLNNPDTNQFYWGFRTSGTPAPKPVYSLGCVNGFSLRADIENNEIKCDNIGTVYQARRLNGLTITLNVLSVLPEEQLAILMDQNQTGIITDTTNNARFMGIGKLQSALWHVLVYNQSTQTGLWLHKCMVEPDTLSIGANEGQFSVTIHVLADTNYPESQQFGVVIRNLPS